MLKTEVSGNATAYIEKIEEMMHRLEEVIEKMNQLSEPGYGTIKETLSADITLIVDDVLKRKADFISERRINIEQTVSHDPASFFADRNSMHVIVDNVVDNAIRYSNPSVSENKICIRNEVASDKSAMTLTIWDNGIGINEEALPYVFDPFYRGTALSNGNGLGLYLVKKILDVIHGTIRVVSTQTEGTTVTITIPGTNTLATPHQNSPAAI
ncbi:MAG: sensor histidine kinase [Bacteroidota bacterium]